MQPFTTCEMIRALCTIPVLLSLNRSGPVPVQNRCIHCDNSTNAVYSLNITGFYYSSADVQEL